MAQQLMEETLEEQADSIEMASMELDSSYEKLQNIMGLRQKNLIDSHKLQCFLSISNYLLEWYNMMNEEIISTIATGYVHFYVFTWLLYVRMCISLHIHTAHDEV